MDGQNSAGFIVIEKDKYNGNLIDVVKVIAPGKKCYVTSTFKYKHSEILSLINQSKKEGFITDEERKIMKEFIVNKEPDLTDDLNQEWMNLGKELILEYLNNLEVVNLALSGRSSKSFKLEKNYQNLVI